MRVTTRIRYACLSMVLVFVLNGCGSTVVQRSLPDSDLPLLIVLSGQSNMVGQGSPDEIPDALKIFPENIHVFDRGEYRKEVDGNRFGPEVTLAHELSKSWPDKEIYFLKYAVGGTSLLAWAPDWDSTRAQITENASAGPLYDQLFNTAERAGLPRNVVPIAVLWMQGERDARFEEAGVHYRENLDALVSRFRNDLSTPELPFVLGRVNPPSDRFAFLSRVRSAQDEAARSDPNIVTLNIDDLTKRTDEVHYDTDGQLELGRRFAAALLELYPNAK